MIRKPNLSVDARYVLPSFAERTSYGMKETNPYSKMFEDRIIFLGTPVDDAAANDVMAQLITLEATDPERDITMYINSPGGSFTAMTAINDTMRYVRPDVQTVCLGQAASSAAILLAAGTPGKRMALPHSRILIHQPAIEGVQGQGTDLEIQAREIMRMRTQMEEMLAQYSGRPQEEVSRDIERNKILTADDAVAYGLVDTILRSRKKSAVAMAAS
ncbi:ATP-dependent Clp protease proteolytic subunit [Micromonospora sp. NPDC052213]|uniref:ATP-dependent Clp protease proteolytic subunit n=1 Tax=Micromonospora sp. NPDC052213 TaxID=3155812 RepID=UPI003439CDFA